MSAKDRGRRLDRRCAPSAPSSVASTPHKSTLVPQEPQREVEQSKKYRGRKGRHTDPRSQMCAPVGRGRSNLHTYPI